MSYVVSDRVEVCIVDCDKQNRQHLAEVLGSAGFGVQEYDSGQDFFERYIYSDTCCALIEMRMPHIAGLDVLKWLKQNAHDTPALMTLNRMDVEAAMEALRWGADDVLSHPLTEHIVVDRVKHVSVMARERRIISSQRMQVLDRIAELSPRERQIVALILAGLGTKQVAQRLHLSYKTVENRRGGIYQKLKVDGLAEMVAMIVPLLGCSCKHQCSQRDAGCGLKPDDRKPCRLNVGAHASPACPLCAGYSQCITHNTKTSHFVPIRVLN